MTPEQRNFQHAFSVAFGIGDLIVDVQDATEEAINYIDDLDDCLLYTSPSPRDRQKSRMPSSA